VTVQCTDCYSDSGCMCVAVIPRVCGIRQGLVWLHATYLVQFIKVFVTQFGSQTSTFNKYPINPIFYIHVLYVNIAISE
jgi:hypothetical protein